MYADSSDRIAKLPGVKNKNPYIKPITYGNIAGQIAGNNPKNVSSQGTGNASAFIDTNNPIKIDRPLTDTLGITGGQALTGITVTPNSTTPRDDTTGTDNTGVTVDPTVMAMIQGLKDAQISANVAALDKAKNSALGNLNTQEASLEPMYYNKRNQAAAQSDVGAMNFAQYMAGKGIKGAAGAMPEIYRNAGLQSQVGALNQQEAQNFADIANQRTNIENGYESDIAAAKAGAESSAMQNSIDAFNKAYQQKIADLNAQGKTSTGAWTLEGTSQNQQNLANEAATIARANYGDIEAEINRRKAINPNDPVIPYLEAERQTKIDKQTAAEAAAAKAKSDAEQQAWNNAFKIWQTNGTATADIAPILGVPVGADTADYNIASINAATSRMNANTSAQNAENKASNSDYTKNDWVSSAISELDNLSVPQRASWLNIHATEIISNAGLDAYNQIKSYFGM